MKKIIYIETPKGSFVKRNENLSVDFISPIPCPFNYGHIKGELGGDGDPLDALLLGSRLPMGTEVDVELVGCVYFIDGGHQDDKLILCPRAPTEREKWMIKYFFNGYVLLKKISDGLRGSACQSTLLDIVYFNNKM
jgi:inorganic pyrophosphatase